jgi:hypothetical protein
VELTMRRALSIAWCLSVAALPAGAAQAQNVGGGTATIESSVQGARGDFNRLRIGTRLQLPPELATVRDAALYLIAPTGYTLTVNPANAQQVRSILSRPIPPIARDYGVLTVEAALLLVAGDDTRLLVDHARRRIAIDPIVSAR